jgi:hypothetical protein
MAYGSVLTDVVQSSVTGTPPQFNDGAGTQTGTLCRAWVNYKGTSTQSIRASFNVSSVTYNGTGDYTINFTNALTDANYSAVVVGGTGTGANKATFDVPIATPTTSAVRVGASNYLASLTDYAYVYVAVFR